MDFNDFGNEAPAWPPFEVHDDVHGITDVGFHGAVGQVHAALQNAARESGQSLPCGSGMYGGKAPRMTRIEKLEKIESLPSANLAQDNPIGTVTERGFEQVANGNGGKAILLPPRFESDLVLVRELNLCRVFNQQQTLVRRDKSSQACRERRLPCSGSTADEQILTGENIVFEAISESTIECSSPDQVLHLEEPGTELADG